jgi:hypothetical protein
LKKDGKKMSYGLADETLGFKVIPILHRITDEEILNPGEGFLSGLIVNKGTWKPGVGFFTKVRESKDFFINPEKDEVENYHLQMGKIHKNLYRQPKPKF